MAHHPAKMGSSADELYIVGLLGIIRNTAHNHDKIKLGLITIIESDIVLYPGFQGPTEPCGDYMAIFKARVDIINVQERFAGKHPGDFIELSTQIEEKQEITR